MLTWIDYINFAIAISGLTISFLAIILTFRIQYMDRWTRQFFLTLFGLLILYVSFDLISQISLKLLGHDFGLLSQGAFFFASFFSALLMPLLTMYILHICNERYSVLLFYIVLMLFFIYTIILILAQFTSGIYYISTDNVFHRGPYYPLLLAAPLIIMLLNLMALFRRREKISAYEKRALYTYLLIPIISIMIQMEVSNFRIIVLGSTIAALILFIHIVNVDADIYIEQKIKIAEQDFRAKTLQMRPHFIYNTLSNVYYLCELDPMKAQKVIDDFTTYLKKNFSAVAKQGLITFEEELQHTKAYLAVVKARYEDLLFVDYDTPVENFKLPPLTLEPLVENAVKHALDPDSDPLYIMIRTRKENSYNLVIVENTGVDFPLEDDSANYSSLVMNDEPHIGLNNVKSRLAASCGGSLKLSKRPDGGTIATIRIPADQSLFSTERMIRDMSRH